MRIRALLTAGAGALVLALAAGGIAGASVVDPADPIAGARRADRDHAYDGTLRIAWRTADGWVAREVMVHSDAGRMAVVGDATATARGSVRAIVDGSTSRLLWRDPADAGPPLSGKYSVDVSAEPRTTVAGRPAYRVTLRDRRGRAREVLLLDAATGLLLRRVSLDEAGRRVRVAGYRSIEVAPTPTSGAVAPTPDAPSGDAPRPVRDLRAPYVMLRRLPGGFELVGTYRTDGGRELYFSDGLYGISLFQWPGELDRDGLPRGGRTWTGVGHGARTWSTPVGTVSVWSGDGVTLAVVSETTPDETERIVASLPGAGPTGTIDRVGELLVGPFTLP